MSKRRTPSRPVREPTREDFATTVADLLDAAEALVTCRADTDELRKLDHSDRGEVLRERFIEAAYGYASHTQQVFSLTRADVERGALAMLGEQQPFDRDKDDE